MGRHAAGIDVFAEAVKLSEADMGYAAQPLP
jgi:hypothetical protein